MDGVFAEDDAFEVRRADSAVGPRRHLDAPAVGALKDFSRRYAVLVERRRDAGELLVLGRDLYHWLDGDGGQLGNLLQRAERPLRFEISVARRYPSAAEWALLAAPWELLADPQGFLAGDVPLGFTPVRRFGRAETTPPPDHHRLGLVFMAASPRGVGELDYEGEETAIMNAVGATALDLWVEESGDPDELGDRLKEFAAMQALHLSCHGHNAWQPSPDAEPRPALWLEDRDGNERPTDADALIRALRGHPPRLVFLSACLTAAAGAAPAAAGISAGACAATASGVRSGVAHSFASSLISAGLPAVLGWDGSVMDGAAIAFAAELYDWLAGRDDLSDAVAEARRAMLGHQNEQLRRDWHLARLWLGPQGGGRIVGGTRRRAMMPATHGHKEFLIKDRQQVPVASHEMFVGRRRELQKVMQILRGGEHAGVLLHGMGRLGKSSLAARIANRRRDLRLAVVFERYGAHDVLDALREALRDHAAGRDGVDTAKRMVRDDPDRLEDALTDLLCGPCAQTDGGAPVLLVVDDLERILVADPAGGRHRVAAAHAPVLLAILRAFDPSRTDSRVLITSRFSFTLNGAEERVFALHLPPLSDAAQRKLARRQIEAAADAGLSGDALDQRLPLLAQVPAIAHGNAGLQDLIGRKLVLNRSVKPAHAEATLTDMRHWLARSDLPADAELRAFLENLAVDRLLDLAGAPGRALLRALTLFDLPVPTVVADKLAAVTGGTLAHLRDLGLVDPFADVARPGEPAWAANTLAAGRVAPLDEGERTRLARAIVADLFATWGGAVRPGERPTACDLQLARLGLLAEDANVVAGSAAMAVATLMRGPAAEASAFGHAALALLDAQGREVPWRLLSETAEATATAGDGDTADALLDRGTQALEDARRRGEAIDPVAAGFLAYAQGDRLMRRGDLDAAQAFFEQAAGFAKAVFDEISATIARGRIADILESRGELDEALRIRREEELPVFERRGDVRSRAVTIGKIADILASRGDLDEALRIRREELLPVFERLGDVHFRAITMGKIADILFRRGELDEALRICREELLPVFERLGDVRERAVTMGKIADILFRRGELDEALRIRREELPVFERLGDVRSRAITMGKIADILESRGDLDEALRIRRDEQLPVYERLGDVRERAVTMGKIADILQSRGDLDRALHILREELLPVFERLGDVHFRAITMGKIADILFRRGELDEALRIRREELLPVFERLGDVRSRAVTMGNIADILASRGDRDQARTLHEQRLDDLRRVGDADGIAHALWSLAQLDLADEKFEAVAPRVAEAYGIMLKLGHADGIAAIGMVRAQFLAAAGERDEARTVLQRSAAMFRKLGQDQRVQQADALMRELDTS